MNNFNQEEADFLTKLIISGRSSEIKKLLLSSMQEKLLFYVSSRDGVTVHQVAKALGSTGGGANSSLKELYDKGYIDRDDIGHVSGGTHYKYYKKNNINK